MSKRGSNSKTVLVLGAGFVAAPLVEMLTRDKNVHVIVASELQAPGDAVIKNVSKTNCESIVLDVLKNQELLESLIQESEVVISLLPYELHPQIAQKCIQFKKNMVTASYLSPELKSLDAAAQAAGITILNEVGLDPGIDHLLAMECFDQVKSNGGKITSFVSYCGGLPAPENTNNPLLYKFSWNPRGVISNTLGSARWLQNGEIREIAPGGGLMDNARGVDFLRGLNLEGFPNRDSLVYRDVYDIPSAHTILRGTLRYKGFCNAMKGLHMMDILSTDPHPCLHPSGPEITWRKFMANLLSQPEDMLATNIKNVIYERVGRDESKVAVFENLGLIDDELVAKRQTPLDTLIYFLQNKLMYQEGERDLIILRHDIDVEWPDSTKEKRNIELVVYGDPDNYSAMSKTVGYPTGIAANMILNGEVQDKGTIVPIKTNIYNTMIKRLRDEGIKATERSAKY